MMRSLSGATLLVAGVYIVISSLSASFLDTRNVVEYPNGPVIVIAPEKSLGAAAPSSSTFEKKKRKRFNEFDFAKQCAWALPDLNLTRNCTFFVRPTPNDGEGISLWVSLIAQAHLLAQQAQCDLVFDYGPDIHVESVLSPNLSSWNWTVPTNFTCRDGCYHWKSPSHSPRISVETISQQQHTSIATVPLYRYAYNRKFQGLALYQEDFASIQRHIPGFVPELGMACSLTSLFQQLSPDSRQFVPDLFTRILPTLHNEHSLVFSLYIRTLQADKAFDKERNNNTNPFVEEASYRNQSLDIIHCAMQQEQVHLHQTNVSYSQVVWLVVSDSKELKEWIAETYTTTTNEQTSDDIPKRLVLTTAARGVHSRSDRRPSQLDFAEALVDWFLIGESDLVVMDKSSVSFGGTAALRTARPVQDATNGKCVRAIPIQKGSNPRQTSNKKQ